MRIVKRLFQYLWLLWTALAFIATGIVAFFIFPLIFNLSSKEKGFHRAINFSRWWCRIFSWITLMPVSVKGRENLKRDLPYIILTNHQSQLDIPVSIIATPISFRFLSKKEVEKIPVLRYPLKRLHLLVDRKSAQSRQESMQKMKASIEEGIPIMVFPEGTRTKGPNLTKDFYDGGFRLAIETQKPIAVLTIKNNWSRQNEHMKFRISPGQVYCQWDVPIETKGMTMEDLPALKEKVKTVMENRIREYYGDELPMNL